MHYLTFLISLFVLLATARYFTKSAEEIGRYFGLPLFVVGVFIVGIGTSLPELIAGILSVNKGSSDVLSGNIIGANISNILLITGLAVVLNKKNIVISSSYLFIDLHYLLGSFFFFYIIAFDGMIEIIEAFFGIVLFLFYSFYLIKGENSVGSSQIENKQKLPINHLFILIFAGAGIYFGANYTVDSLGKIATDLSMPPGIVALTLLSLGTTLPELSVNINAIKQGKAEMAIGNVLGSCIFNTFMIPGIASFFGQITVSDSLLTFSLPVMAACGVLFYMITQDKRISVWEGLMFLGLYALFIFKTAT